MRKSKRPVIRRIIIVSAVVFLGFALLFIFLSIFKFQVMTSWKIALFFILAYVCSALAAVAVLMRAKKNGTAVFEEIKRGNLTARLNGYIAEGGIGELINEMCSEIERIVEQLHQAEAARADILQELAHDLKTPIASLRGLLESLQNREDQMSESERREFFNAAIGETLFFGRLVKDLLLISSVSTPYFKPTTKGVEIVRLIDEEVRPVAMQDDIKITVNAPEKVFVLGDELLLRRLIRNGFDNAVSFAASKIHVEIRRRADQCLIRIQDDGPGISDSDLEGFGQKRISRTSSSVRNGRISLGLGSVIMKKIANLHSGDVEIKNGNGGFAATGAELIISLKAQSS